MSKYTACLLLVLIIIVTSSPSSIASYGQSQQTSINKVQSDADVEKNKKIIEEFTNAFNERNLSALDNLVAKDIIEHRPGAGQGIDATKGFLNALETAFPDFKTTLNHVIAEGDKVVVFTNTTGTHQGPFIFAPNTKPTGKILSFQTADLYRLENGKIAEHWDVVEFMDMLQKMGAIQFTNTSASAPMKTSS